MAPQQHAPMKRTLRDPPRSPPSQPSHGRQFTTQVPAQKPSRGVPDAETRAALEMLAQQGQAVQLDGEVNREVVGDRDSGNSDSDFREKKLTKTYTFNIESLRSQARK